jgi:hypothetical protein
VSTVDGLNAAWDAYMAAVPGGDVTTLVRARERLYEAAQAHASVSRPLGNITRYYAAVNDDPDASPGDVQDIAQELDAMRRATAVLNGAWPGTAPAVGG